MKILEVRRKFAKNIMFLMQMHGLLITLKESVKKLPPKIIKSLFLTTPAQ